MTGPRVLHIGKFYAPARGGIETVLQTLCLGESQRVQTRALVVNRSRLTRHDVVNGVPVTRVGSPLKVGAVAVAPMLPRWVARADADVIVLHEPNPMALVAYFVVRPRAPLIVWFHSEVVRPRWRYRLFYRPFLEFALRRAARVVVSSPAMRHAPALAAYRSKCVVIPYGIDAKRFQPTDAIEAQADVFRQRAGRPILLFVGRLVRYKGVDVLLDALTGLDAETVIVGDGPHRAALEARVRERGLAERVRFTGEVTDDELVTWLHACAALVLPSITRQEAFGMVQLEAMLCGRPVVSTDVPTGVPWVNTHGRTGLVVRAGDVESLRKALAKLVADEPLRRRLGEGARTRVLERFTADRMCESVMALYRDLVRPVPAVSAHARPVAMARRASG